MPNRASFIQHSNKEEEKKESQLFKIDFKQMYMSIKKQNRQKKQNSYQINKSHQQQYFHQTPSKMLYNDYKTRDGMYNRTTLIGHA